MSRVAVWLVSCTNPCTSNNSQSDTLLCADCCQEVIADNSLQLPRFLESCKWWLFLFFQHLHLRQWKFSFFYFVVMQDSPRVGVRWSIIILNGLSYEDAGEYRCQARNMAGISEALIKLKVVGVTSSSRLPKRKGKTGAKPSSKYRRPSKAGSLSVKDQQVRKNVTSSYLNREQLLTFWETWPQKQAKMMARTKKIKISNWSAGKFILF